MPGTQHSVEHGPAPDRAVRWLRRGHRLDRVVSGCILDNDVGTLLAGSSLTVAAMDRHDERSAPGAAGYLYEGRATA